MHFIRLALPFDKALRVPLLCVLSATGVLLYSSWGRALWIDEFLHFATAAYGTTAEAWDVIRRSTTGVNHGQTGIYMLLDFWLLKIFGANVIALRAPSLVCAFFLFYISATILRIRGFGLVWQCVMIFALFSQPHLMYYAGEARPYMPLATASVGTLLYAVASPAQRAERSISALGIGSIVLGSLIHPYFSLYWLTIFCFGYWLGWLNSYYSFSIRSILDFLNLPVCIIGVVLYFTIGGLTWLAVHPTFDRNPFEDIAQTDLVRIFIWHHLEFLGYPERSIYLLGSMCFVLLIYFALPVAMKLRFRPIVAPAVLTLLALALSFLLSSASYFQNYWILSRQWVASIALVAVAIIWFGAELVRLIANARPFNLQAQYVSVGLTVMIVLYGARLNQHNTIYRVHSLVADYQANLSSQPVSIKTIMRCPFDNQVWSDLANENIKLGGKVWKFFTKYYENALGGKAVCPTNIETTADLAIE